MANIQMPKQKYRYCRATSESVMLRKLILAIMKRNRIFSDICKYIIVCLPTREAQLVEAGTLGAYTTPRS